MKITYDGKFYFSKSIRCKCGGHVVIFANNQKDFLLTVAAEGWQLIDGDWVCMSCVKKRQGAAAI